MEQDQKADEDKDACPWWLQLILLTSLLAGAVGTMYVMLGGG